MTIPNRLLDPIIHNALQEDMPWGDITTEATVPAEAQIRARLLAKSPCVVCGLFVMERVFQVLDPAIVFAREATEGERVEKGRILARISGPARAILSAERVGLNLLQRMCGIATRTAELADQVAGTKTKICDTRKTTPGLRLLEKHAVKAGGGSNHRYNLGDGVMIKDNHIRAAGGITPAIERARAAIPHTVKIEVETENLAQVKEALAAGAEIIMLDNMSIAAMKEAVDLIAGRAITEASGNMGEKDLSEVAATGVDLISIGGLTHTVTAADISLKFD